MMDKAFVKLNKHLSAIKYKDHSRQLQVTVFYNCVPVASFNCEKLAERKLAAVELVERKICNHQTVAQLCGFHRNTIAKLLALKSTLGITA
jgi:hypothetical protein